jgi:hypothetical protein
LFKEPQDAGCVTVASPPCAKAAGTAEGVGLQKELLIMALIGMAVFVKRRQKPRRLLLTASDLRGNLASPPDSVIKSAQCINR